MPERLKGAGCNPASNIALVRIQPCPPFNLNAPVAQLEEYNATNVGAGGSNPFGRTMNIAGLAQLVERNPPTVEARGSSPLSRSMDFTYVPIV